MLNSRPPRPIAMSIAVTLTCLSGLQAEAADDAILSSADAPPLAVEKIAHGTFEIQLTPAPTTPSTESAKLGRLSFHKQFQGDLDATSLGEMLSFRTPVAGSAGYVAMERVEGKLGGRSGSFVLMHLGEMARGQPQLTVQVVPDSGTGELVGLSGALTIDVRDGKHSYVFQYKLLPRK